MNNQYNEEEKVNNRSTGSENEYAYKTVISKKENRRTLSIISLAFAVLSILSLVIPWLGFIFCLISVGMGAFSRKNLGYFDRLTLAGLIIDIFGFVFAVSGMIFGSLMSLLF